MCEIKYATLQPNYICYDAIVNFVSYKKKKIIPANMKLRRKIMNIEREIV